jgi:hypothetical protein
LEQKIAQTAVRINALEEKENGMLASLNNPPQTAQKAATVDPSVLKLVKTHVWCNPNPNLNLIPNPNPNPNPKPNPYPDPTSNPNPNPKPNLHL